MRNIFFALFLMMTVTCDVMAQYADLGDSVRFRIGYATTFMREYGQKSGCDEMTILDIGSRKSVFYSVKNNRSYELIDSMHRNGISPHAYIDIVSQHGYKGPRITYYVLKDHSSVNSLTYYSSCSSMFQSEENMTSLPWCFADGDTIVCGYPCKKAMMTYRGREWTAWYALDIPVSEGPWKLRGLPGLILCAYESEGVFRFDCNGISNGNGEEMRMVDVKTIKCTPEKMIEMERMLVEDPDVLYGLIHGQRIYTFDKDGKLMDYSDKKACLKERKID